MAIFGLFPAKDICKTKIDVPQVDYACVNYKYVWSNGTYCPSQDARLIIAPPYAGNFVSNSFFHASKASALDLASSSWKEFPFDRVSADDAASPVGAFFLNHLNMGDLSKSQLLKISYDIHTRKAILAEDMQLMSKRGQDVSALNLDEADTKAINAAFSTDRLILNNDQKAMANFAAGSYLELVAFYTSGTIAETIPTEYLEGYKYTSGAIIHGAKLLQSRDIYDASGRMTGYGVGFFIREEILEPILGAPVPSNVNTSTVAGALKAAHIYNSIDSLVIGVNANLMNFMPPEQVFAGAVLKNAVDPFLFNVVYDYTGIADEDAMKANTVLSFVGVGLQIAAECAKPSNTYTYAETANIILKKNAMIVVTNFAAVLTVEFLLKPALILAGDYVFKPALDYSSKLKDSVWDAASASYDSACETLMGEVYESVEE